MHTVKVALILAAILLGGCGAQPGSFDNTSGKQPPPALAASQPKWQLVEPAAPTRDERGVLRSPIDQMPLVEVPNSEPYRDDQGILRSPIDQMPIIPGDPNVAPMPGK
jgi:hypothetical protein